MASRHLKNLLHNPAYLVDSCVRHMGFLLPDRLFLSLRFRCLMGKWIDWKNPMTFCEKLQWLKVYNRKPEYTAMVDKAEAKHYAAFIIGEEHIIPTLGVWEHFDDIDFATLPDKFVLKTTNGGGGCGVVICKDKAVFNKEDAKKKLETSLRNSIYRNYREWPYKNVKRQVIAEKFMIPDDKLNDPTYDLTDYKFFCFNGVPKFCQVIRNRHTCESIDFYDMDWNHQGFVGLNPVARNGLTPVARPEHFDEMKGICRKLAKNIPFVRIDLYIIDNDIYFGEITFYPASGFGKFTPEDSDLLLGKLLNLN